MFYHYPVFIRIWHLLNALFFLVLILTGLSMQYSNPDQPFISFPVSVQLHNICGIGLTINYMIFFIGNISSGNGKNYRIQFRGLTKKLILQAKYYTIGYFKKAKKPFPISEDRKFNPLQAVTYMMSMYIGLPLLFITGWGLLFPESILDRIFGVSGFVLTDLVHIIIGFLLSIFMVIHIYLCSVGTKPKDNYRAIITGWGEIEE